MRYLLLTIMLMLSSVCFAQEKAYVLNDFSGGQNSHISEYNTPARQMNEAKNVRVNSKYSAVSNRQDMVEATVTAGDAIQSLHRYYLSDNTEYTIQTSGTKVYYDNDSGTMTEMHDGLSEGLRFKWYTYQDTAIGFNSVDLSIKWDGETQTTADTDGSRTEGDLMAELGAPYAELNTGANLDASSWYMYTIAYTDGATYFYTSARSNPIQTGATVQDVTLTDIPLGPAGTTERYIYRTLGNSTKANALSDTNYYLVATISNNIDKTIDDDMIDDTADDDAVPTYSTITTDGFDITPPISDVGTFHNDRLYKSSTVDPSYLFWSEAYLPHFFAPEDAEIIREDDGDKITALVEYLGILRIFKTNTVQNWYATAISDASWYYSAPFSKIGCHAPYSVAVTTDGVIYLNRDGLFMFSGQGSSLISDAVTDVVKDISELEIEEATAVYFDNEYHLSYTSSESGQLYNNRILMYDLIRNSYVVDTKKINCFTVYNASDDFGVIYGGSSIDDGIMWAFESNASKLVQRYKTDFEDGTFVDARVYNTEDRPILEISRTQTIDDSVGTIDAQTGDINRNTLTGSWTSPIYNISAGSLEKLLWHESLSQGDITFQIRTGATDTAVGLAAWSDEFTDPNGSDISDVASSKKYQVRINFTTTDFDFTPLLFYSSGYVVKTLYFKTGATAETGVSTVVDTGWRNLFGAKDGDIYNKKITRIRVFYEGEEGNVNLEYKNEEGDVDYNFDIDLSINVNTDVDNDNENDYTISGENKIRTFYPKANYSANEPESIGQFFRFIASSEDAELWTIHKIEVRFEFVEFDD